MKLLMAEPGKLSLTLNAQETSILSNLVSQLLALLQSHSSVALDPDPLLASHEIGGTDCLPDDPALARLLPNAYLDPELASEFRQVTEQGLINRKIEDAFLVATMLTSSATGYMVTPTSRPASVIITADSLDPWVRTLTALRLSIAARIGIEKDADHGRLRNDPAHENTLMIYEWIAALTQLILSFAPAMDDTV